MRVGSCGFNSFKESTVFPRTGNMHARGLFVVAADVYMCD